jgi:phosphohistidine phosphatase
MELILWRHADAEPAAPGQPDETRALTAKGNKQAQRMADWLNRNLPESCRILVSPAVRTVQTADALGRKFKTSAALAPDASPEDILHAARWPDSREPVLVVGHQPALGQVAAMLIGGAKQDWTLRKGSACWIVRKIEDEMETTYIKALIGPELAGK